MDAVLSRLLARIIDSPYWKEFSFALQDLPEFVDKPFNDEIALKTLIDLSLKAFKLEKLPQAYQEFLKGCDRSNAVRFYLFRGSNAGKIDKEKNQAVIDQMEAWDVLSQGDLVITNRDRFPDVDFLEDSEIKAIGDVGGTPLYLIGKEQGSDAPIVSREGNYGSVLGFQIFSAVPLYSLMSQPEPIRILEPLSSVA